MYGEIYALLAMEIGIRTHYYLRLTIPLTLIGYLTDVFSSSGRVGHDVVDFYGCGHQGAVYLPLFARWRRLRRSALSNRRIRQLNGTRGIASVAVGV